MTDAERKQFECYLRARDEARRALDEEVKRQRIAHYFATETEADRVWQKFVSQLK